MSSQKINPRTGQFNLVGEGGATNWNDIVGKPSSTPANIDGAVSAKHTQNTDNVLKSPHVSLLLHMDGVNGAQVFTDETGKSVTAQGAVYTDTANKVTGTASAHMLADSDYLQIANNADFAMGAEDFVIEAWVYLISHDVVELVDLNCSGTAYIPAARFMIHHNVLHPAIQNSDGSTMIDLEGLGVLTVPDNEWAHVAFVRKGNQLSGYINGNLSGTATLSGSGIMKDFGLATDIGRGLEANFVGLIDEVRILKGGSDITLIEQGTLIQDLGVRPGKTIGGNKIEDITEAVEKRNRANVVTIEGGILSVAEANYISTGGYDRVDIANDFNYVAQTFVAKYSGNTVKVMFALRQKSHTSGAGDNLQIELRTVGLDGKPTATVLDTISVAYADILDGDVWNTAEFTPTVEIVRGTAYAVVFTLPTLPSSTGTNYQLRAIFGSDLYTDGFITFSSDNVEWTDENLNPADMSFQILATVTSGDFINNGTMQADLDMGGKSIINLAPTSIKFQGGGEITKADTEKIHDQNTDNVLQQGVSEVDTEYTLYFHTAFYNTIPSADMPHGIPSSVGVAQTFKAPITGVLKQAVFCIEDSNHTGTLTIEVRDVVSGGLPGTTILGSQIIPPANIMTGPWIYEPYYRETLVPFSTPIAVTQNTEYALVIHPSDGAWCNVFGSNETPYYTDGAAFNEDSANVWSNFGHNPGSDMYCKITIGVGGITNLIENGELINDLAVTAGRKIGGNSIEDITIVVRQKHRAPFAGFFQNPALSSGGIYRIQHNMGLTNYAVLVAIYDNNDTLATSTSIVSKENYVDVDLSAYAPISGWWSYIVQASGVPII